MYSDTYEIRRELANNYNFQECVIEELRWKHQGAVIEIDFGYIWSDQQGLLLERGVVKVRGGRIDVEAPPVRVTLRFVGVQEFRVRNAFSEKLLQKPESIAWGLSEVAFVELAEDDLFLTPYRSTGIYMHHLCLRFESDRRIDVVFHALETEVQEPQPDANAT